MMPAFAAADRQAASGWRTIPPGGGERRWNVMQDPSSLAVVRPVRAVAEARPAPRPAMKPFARSTLFVLCAAAALGSAAAADRLVTSDGRILEVKKARALADGSYQLVFENGEIVCPKQFVASVEIEGDMSDYVPANEDEKKKLAEGYVRYRAKWLSKAAYLAELDKQAVLSKARTADLAAHATFSDGWRRRPSTSRSSPTPRPRCSPTTPTSWRRTTT
jgi:hypothetical protein